MRLLASHFVLGETIGEALHRAEGHGELLYSYDMLGEGARTADDADYPVFTRKPLTDLCYLACARALLVARPHVMRGARFFIEAFLLNRYGEQARVI